MFKRLRKNRFDPEYDSERKRLKHFITTLSADDESRQRAEKREAKGTRGGTAKDSRKKDAKTRERVEEDPKEPRNGAFHGTC